MTEFEMNALVKIKHVGGSIYFEAAPEEAGKSAAAGSFVDQHGQKVFVPSPGFKTEGVIGWPTVQSLMQQEKLYHRSGNQYSLTKGASS